MANADDIVLHGAKIGKDVASEKAEAAQSSANEALQDIHGLVDLLATKEPTIFPTQSTDYLAGDKVWRNFANSVRTTVLNGLSILTATAITDNDTVLSGFGKLQAQLNAFLVSLNLKANSSDVNTALATKADKGNTLAAYGITNAYTKTETDTKFQDLVGTAGAALDTLGEIATQLQNDESAVTALTNQVAQKADTTYVDTQLATKEPKINAGTTAQYWRGDKTWQSLASAVLATVLTGLSTITATPIVSTDTVLVALGKLQAQYNTLQTAVNGKEPSIALGTTTQYWRGDKSWQDLATSVRAVVLTGLSTATNTVITASDSLLSALGRLQAQILARVMNLGNVPSIQSGTFAARPAAGTNGRVYIAIDVPAVYQDDGTVWVTIALGAIRGGAILQAISTSIAAASGTAQKADSNTTPLITDGIQVWSQQITPIVTDGTISVRGSVYVDHSNNNRRVACALFRDNVCVGVASSNVQQAGSGITMALSFKDVPNTTTPVTYSIRTWANGGGTWYLNQCSTPYFNGMMAKQALDVLELA